MDRSLDSNPNVTVFNGHDESLELVLLLSYISIPPYFSPTFIAMFTGFVSEYLPRGFTFEWSCMCVLKNIIRVGAVVILSRVTQALYSTKPYDPKM